MPVKETKMNTLSPAEYDNESGKGGRQEVQVSLPEVENDMMEEIMSKIATEIKETTDFDIDTTDGVKILKEDGWVIIRPSGTEPIFRSYSESDSQEKADEMAEYGISLIKKYRD